jgi:hypothetical protein
MAKVQKAIIHSPTRVIRRLTTEDPPRVLADEEAIVMDPPITLNEGYRKLDVDNVTLLVPTTQEIDDADVDEAMVAAKRQAKRDAYKSALDTAVKDGTLPQTVRDVFTTLKELG